MRHPPDRPGGPSVGLIGYGRFGRAFAALLQEEGVPVRAIDMHAAVVPEELRSPDIGSLVGGAEFVVVAVPIPAMRSILGRIRPLLAPGQVVFDVGSVKVKPVEAMAEVLGDAVPWAATHPLFGPVSLALAERPLRVVLCASPSHPDAARRVRALYERIGCEVTEQGPEAHDRMMASTHALTFFVAKGLLDAGIDDNVPFAPPSFQAIARTIASVREDAGHLFSAIQLENPFAAEARERLLSSLASIHKALEQSEASGAVETEEFLAIPASSSPPPELMETRELIDGVDREIVKLIVQRAELARRAGRVKAGIGKGIRDQVREAALFEARRKWAAEAGLDEETVDSVFRSLVSLARRVQGDAS